MAVVGRASALSMQPLDVFRRPAEPHWGMTTLLEALECSTVHSVEADRMAGNRKGATLRHLLQHAGQAAHQATQQWLAFDQACYWWQTCCRECPS